VNPIGKNSGCRGEPAPVESVWMVASSNTRVRLNRVTLDLRREFPDLSDDHVDEVFRRVADDLLARARFDDFLPLLVHRRAAERLRAASPH
jgi:phage terminase Nu1 subunit (DNA packaging protein)